MFLHFIYLQGNDNADGRLEVCKDDISECAFYEQQGLCKNQPLIQTMCKKSCDLCPATGTGIAEFLFLLKKYL